MQKTVATTDILFNERKKKMKAQSMDLENKTMLNFIFEALVYIFHKKYDIGIEDKSGWGFRCKKCEEKHKRIIWHKNF